MAKSVPHDALSFDDSVNKTDPSYIVDYTAVISPSETDLDIAVASTGRKIPLGLTILGMTGICSAAWVIAILAIFKIFAH